MRWLALASFLALGGGLVLWIDWCRNRWDPPERILAGNLEDLDWDLPNGAFEEWSEDESPFVALFQGGPERPRTGRI